MFKLLLLAKKVLTGMIVVHLTFTSINFMASIDLVWTLIFLKPSILTFKKGFAVLKLISVEKITLGSAKNSLLPSILEVAVFMQVLLGRLILSSPK